MSSSLATVRQLWYFCASKAEQIEYLVCSTMLIFTSPSDAREETFSSSRLLSLNSCMRLRTDAAKNDSSTSSSWADTLDARYSVYLLYWYKKVQTQLRPNSMHLKLGNDFCKWHSWDLQESVCGCVELSSASSVGRRVDGQISGAKVLQKLKLVVPKHYKTCMHRLAQLAVVEHTSDLRCCPGNRLGYQQ